MAKQNCIRWAILSLVGLGLIALGSAQTAPIVSGYSPAQTTVGYLPSSNLPVTITLNGTQVPPDGSNFGMRAYWDVQGTGSQIPVSGAPGATTAVVTVSPALRTAGQHTVLFCIVANLGSGQIESCTNAAASATFTVNPTPAITTPSPLPIASTNTPYSLRLAATGGTGTLTWSLAPGSSPPPGLLLNASTGTISGTPTQAGIYNFTVAVTDALGVSVSRQLAISVTSALSITTPATLPTAQVSVTYSITIQVAGGVPPYSYSTDPTQLPPGLVLNSSSGVLSGTPSVAGDYRFLVTVFDSQRVSVERAFFITVSETVSTPTILTANPLPGATVGAAYEVPFAASGGTSPYQFFLSAGDLPPGLNLDGRTGVLSGSPSQTGDFNFVIGVIDTLERSSTKTFSLRVSEGLSITTTQLPAGTVGERYTTTSITVTGGSEPYTFSTTGNFPPGLALNPTSGAIGGTPTQSGVFAFNVLVRDAAQRLATRSYSVTIGAGLRFRTNSPLPSGQVGQAYDQFVEVEGGTAPYQFQRISGDLPAGLSLSTSGRLQGTPTAAFDGSFTLRATDSGNPPLTAERQFALRISTSLVITTESLPPGIVGQSYSQIITATGGNAPYSFTVSTGVLPPGLLLARTNGTISGTPTTLGSFPFTILVTDSNSRSGTRDYTLEVRPAPVSGATVTLQTGIPPANTQQEVDVSLDTPRSDVISGTLFLEFAPSVTPAVDDPATQFVSGGRQSNFQILAGQTSARFGESERALFQTGTVAGTITLRAQLRIDGADVTPSPAPTSTIVLPPLAPTLTSLAVTRTGTGLNVVVRGFSTPRNMTSATMNFTARAGSNITSGLSFSVDLAAAFTTWNTSGPSANFGSQFQLTLPVAISGDSTEITGLSIALSNSVGGSNSLSATF